MKDTRVILIIEDSVEDAALIQVAFQKSGFENPIQTAEGVKQALSYLGGEGEYSDRGKFPFPHLVLLDHKMPGDGWPVIEWVRGRSDLEWLPVVVFSGSDDPNHQQKAYALGANAYHVKPQRFEEFTETIRRIGDFWLRSWSPEAQP